MSRRTSEASKAIRTAWEKERELVLVGKGTRNWTPEQQQSIIDNGKAYDDDGKAFEGHHMKSAEAYPEYQGDSGNIQFLSRSEHQEAHGGSYHNPTNGYYDPVAKISQDFGDGIYQPCKEIELSDPIMLQKVTPVPEQSNVKSTGGRQISSETTDKPNNNPIKNKKTREMPPSHSPMLKSRVSKTQDHGVKKAIATITNSLDKAVKWTWNHKNEIIACAATVGNIGYYIASVVSKSNAENSDHGRYQSTSEGTDDSFVSNDDANFEGHDESEKGTHASPREHIVKPHGQRYGKNKVWKEKKAYPRGGKNKDGV